MANKVIFTYILLAIIILFIKLRGTDDAVDLELYGVSFIVYISICYLYVNYSILCNIVC